MPSLQQACTTWGMQHGYNSSVCIDVHCTEYMYSKGILESHPPYWRQTIPSVASVSLRQLRRASFWITAYFRVINFQLSTYTNVNLEHPQQENWLSEDKNRKTCHQCWCIMCIFFDSLHKINDLNADYFIWDLVNAIKFNVFILLYLQNRSNYIRFGVGFQRAENLAVNCRVVIVKYCPFFTQTTPRQGSYVSRITPDVVDIFKRKASASLMQIIRLIQEQTLRVIQKIRLPTPNCILKLIYLHKNQTSLDNK